MGAFETCHTDGSLVSVGADINDAVALRHAQLHAILDSNDHSDSTTGTCTRGDIITAQAATPTWTRLAITVPAAGLVNFLGAVNGDTEPGYKALFDVTVPGTIAAGASAAAGTAVVAARRDHVHGAPATWAATAHHASHEAGGADVVAVNGYMPTGF